MTCDEIKQNLLNLQKSLNLIDATVIGTGGKTVLAQITKRGGIIGAVDNTGAFALVANNVPNAAVINAKAGTWNKAISDYEKAINLAKTNVANALNNIQANGCGCGIPNSGNQSTPMNRQ